MSALLVVVVKLALVAPGVVPSGPMSWSEATMVKLLGLADDFVLRKVTFSLYQLLTVRGVAPTTTDSCRPPPLVRRCVRSSYEGVLAVGACTMTAAKAWGVWSLIPRFVDVTKPNCVPRRPAVIGVLILNMVEAKTVFPVREKSKFTGSRIEVLSVP